MKSRVIAVVCVLLGLACKSAPEPVLSGAEAEAAKFGSEVTCPPTMPTPENGTCGVYGRTKPGTCTYPDGRCRCVVEPFCQGVAPQPGPTWMVWQCFPPARPDDCPDDPPVAGSACGIPDKACHWPGCGESTDCTCTAGAWACHRNWEGGPPP